MIIYSWLAGRPVFRECKQTHLLRSEISEVRHAGISWAGVLDLSLSSDFVEYHWCQNSLEILQAAHKSPQHLKSGENEGSCLTDTLGSGEENPVRKTAQLSRH